MHCANRYVAGKAEAQSRKGFFTGVATICVKLFNITTPNVVVLGKKDRLQCYTLIQVFCPRVCRAIALHHPMINSVHGQM